MLISMRNPLKLARRQLRRLGIVPETKIEIHPWYPFGFDAVLAANNRVYILKYRQGKWGLEIQPIWGFWPSGNLILKGE